MALTTGNALIPMPDQQHITLTSLTSGVYGYHDGPAAQALFKLPWGIAVLLSGSVLVVDHYNHCIRMISADGKEVSTVAGTVQYGHQDGPAAQARFHYPAAVVVLSDGRILVADGHNHRIRVISADLQQVTTVAGAGTRGYRDGAAAQATFYYPCGLAVLPDGRVLVSQSHCIRVLSADLQEVTTVAGTGEAGHHDGAGVQARFAVPTGMLVLPDNRVLVAD